MNPAHFVLMVKKNQPQSYEEIVKYFGATSDVKTFLEKGSRRRPKPVQDFLTDPLRQVNSDPIGFQNRITLLFIFYPSLQMPPTYKK